MTAFNDFESKLNKFIDKLKNTKIGNYFNPWSDFGELDDRNAPNIRLSNLRKFLLARKNAKYLLVGEAPSVGARYTGIPMTSEKVINENPDIFINIKTTSKRGNIEEKTAKIIWDEIKKVSPKCNEFVLWNAFALNKNSNGDYVDKFTTNLLTNKANIILLKLFLDLFRNAKIIAIGRTAQITIGYAKSLYIKHPSHYKHEFTRKFEEIVHD